MAVLSRPISTGEIAKVPQLTRTASNGASLLDPCMTHGMRMIFRPKKRAFLAFFLLPDDPEVTDGIMWDESGHDVLGGQLSKISDAISTARIGPNGKHPPASNATDEIPDASPLALARGSGYAHGLHLSRG
jgi:hypothetical protein